MDIIYTILAMIVGIDLVSFITYGWFVTDVDISNARLNSNNNNLISLSDTEFTFASKSMCYLPLSKWTIYGRGRVLRWSKLHNKLEKLHKELIEKN